MMELLLSAQQKELMEDAKRFTDAEIVPHADRFDQEERIPRELIDKLAAKGYLGSMISKAYQGLELDAIAIGLLNEEIGRGCSSTRSLLTVHGMVALALARWGKDEQRKKWLPELAAGKKLGAFALTEPNIGSDANNIETTAELKADSFVINGKKKWITMGQIADLILVLARCEDKPTAILVERNTPGLEIIPIKGVFSAKASLLAELHFNACKVPAENLICRVGMGLTHVALNSLDYGRYTIAWGCVGLGQACLEASIRYARTRKQFGKPLRHYQLIQKMITEMTVNVQAARLLCMYAGQLKNMNDPESIMATWNAKYFSSKMSNQVAGDAVQLHGANGLSDQHVVSRFFRDAKSTEIIEGTSQMHEVLISMRSIGSI